MILYPAYGPNRDLHELESRCRPREYKILWCNQATSNNSEEMQHVE